MPDIIPDVDAIPDSPQEMYFIKRSLRWLNDRLQELRVLVNELRSTVPATQVDLAQRLGVLERKVTALENAPAPDTSVAEFDKCHVSNNANQSIADSTLTALAFNTEEYDVGGMHDVAVSNTRITFKKTKKYHITANVIFATNATGIRQIRLQINGGAYIVMHNFDALASNETTLVASEDYSATTGDYVEVVVFQDSGGPLNVSFIDTRSPRFAAHELA